MDQIQKIGMLKVALPGLAVQQMVSLVSVVVTDSNSGSSRLYEKDHQEYGKSVPSYPVFVPLYVLVV